MTATEIRQSFLDFFKSKGHSIVPSSSLLPNSPNLLFTNAGMNQFVPIFLGQRKPDVSKWPGAIPGLDTRAANTQKCIRAGGKHNDLEDVGLDTYHHTFFEMLGNWSFGDYFKREAIQWAWELLVEQWKFPPERLYATVYKPAPGDPSEVDREAYDVWAEIFRRAGLDPAVHIQFGGMKDNFWMMGDTGPCGPCSEIHVDLTPRADSQGKLVNAGSSRCIEIWNLVFIQFNANPDGTLSPLPARHVDTGMGLERVAAIVQCTNGLKDFANAQISNYATDLFRPLFDALERLSGKRYGGTVPASQSALANSASQVAIDVAFRVIADHIRTLGFAIADGILPSNEGRGYVLRRILRRAVRYGRTLGFHEPFFYRLIDVLADTMGDVFPEIRTRKAHVKDVIQHEEEAFNRTLDRGIALFEEEVARLLGTVPVATGGTGYQHVAAGKCNLPTAPGAVYSRRNLPHLEKPWAIYVVEFRTADGRTLSPVARDIVFDCILHWRGDRYRLIAACVMPDHVHFIIQPGIKGQDEQGNPVFWSLAEILHSIKSFSANEINKAEGKTGQVWQDERYDRYVRSDRDLEEKFNYICRNPWAAGLVGENEPWPWLWTEDIEAVRPYVPPAHLPYRMAAGQIARHDRLVACSTQSISGEFAFKLYDTYGFPLDLTQLMARERGLTVDVDGFNRFMEEQRARARAAQKKTVIELSQIETATPTKFVGYDTLETTATVLEVVSFKNKTAVILDVSPCYAEMGGQVGDTGELEHGSQIWPITDTQRVGETWLHFIDVEAGASEAESVSSAEPNTTPAAVLPNAGTVVTVSVDRARREAVQRHHTVTHLLHWALLEVVSRNIAQKGSLVAPDKLTFDFNSPPLTSQQLADVERLVNERIVEDAPVSWTEVPYADVKGRPDIRQIFGEKYGQIVRVVQIGGRPGALDGYSMELCGGTHCRATGQIGLFRILNESAIAAGVRRIEAVAGLEAYRRAQAELALIRTVAEKVNSPPTELERKVENIIEQLKSLEKQLKTLKQQQAAETAKRLATRAVTINTVPAIIERVDADADTLQCIVNELKGKVRGVIVLGGVANGAVALVASVSPEFTSKIHAGKIIQQLASIVGGKGGGKPDNARGGGRDTSKLDAALARAKALF